MEDNALSLKEIFIFVVNFFKFLVAGGSLTDPVLVFYFRQMLLSS